MFKGSGFLFQGYHHFGALQPLVNSGDGSMNRLHGDPGSYPSPSYLSHLVYILLMAEILHHLGCMKPYK